VKRIEVTLTDEEHRDLWVSAMYKHIKARNPVAAVLVQNAFGLMAKYAIPDARREELEAKYLEAYPDAQAVQPDALQGNSNGGQA